MNLYDTARAMARTSEVFPVPGGPQKMMDERVLLSIKLRSIQPGLSKWSWPTTRSTEAGRIRSARGAKLFLLPTEVFVPKIGAGVD